MRKGLSVVSCVFALFIAFPVSSAWAGGSCKCDLDGNDDWSVHMNPCGAESSKDSCKSEECEIKKVIEQDIDGGGTVVTTKYKDIKCTWVKVSVVGDQQRVEDAILDDLFGELFLE